MKRRCDNCGKEYNADERNLKRGWGLCCSKSCAAKKRERSKPGYNSARVKENNYRRKNWFDYYENDDDAIEALGMDYLLECGDRD
jgi:hypothetical protein